MNIEKLKDHECRFCKYYLDEIMCELADESCAFQWFNDQSRPKDKPILWELHPDIAEEMEVKKVIPTKSESEGKLYQEGLRLGLIATGRSDFHLGWRFCYDWIAEAMP